MEKKIYDEYISIRQHSIIVSPHNASEMIYILMRIQKRTNKLWTTSVHHQYYIIRLFKTQECCCVVVMFLRK